MKGWSFSVGDDGFCTESLEADVIEEARRKSRPVAICGRGLVTLPLPLAWAEGEVGLEISLPISDGGLPDERLRL